MSGEFGQVMVCILGKFSRAKVPMRRPREPDLPPERTRYDLDIYRTKIRN